MIDTNLLSLEFKSLADRHGIPLHERQLFKVMLDNIDRLRAELDRYKTSLDDAIFYGKPFAYWQELEAHAKELNYDTLVDAIVTLRHRLDRYRWHPYPQEKPETGKEYQITTEDGILVDYYTYIEGDEPDFIWERVTAYRPMPEAYKPEEEK